MSSNQDYQHLRNEATPLLQSVAAEESECVVIDVSPFQLDQTPLDECESLRAISSMKDRLLLVSLLGLVLLTMGACYSVHTLETSFAEYSSKMIPLSEVPQSP